MYTKEIDLSGETVGNYKIINQLGRGGMAVVYKAHESSLNRIVALKVLSSQLSMDTEYIKRFQREARAAAQLNHPNIVQIYAIGEEQGIHYFAMEYIKGKSLADVSREMGKMSPQKAIPIIKQVAEALGEAHKAGLVHRDIKPGNIMIDAMGRAKVTDFGIAYVSREQTRLTQEGSIIGTPEYLSPEQCEGKEVDGRSDIYSLGVLFYELLTGTPPYEADTPVSMLMNIVKGNFLPIAEANPAVPASVRQIVEKMMQTEKDERYANVNELLKALAEVEREDFGVKDMMVVEPAADIVEHVDKQKGKNRSRLIALMLTAVIVLLLGGAFAAKVLYFDKQDTGKSGKVKSTALLPGGSEAAAGLQDEQAGPGEMAEESEQNVVPMGSETAPGTMELDDQSSPEPVSPGSSSVLTAAASKDASAVTPQKGPEAEEFSTPTKPAPRPLPEEKAPVKKLPPANSVVLTTLGDDDKDDFITAHIQSILKNDDFTVIDGPSVDRAQLADIATYHFVTTVKHMGTTTLQYYGSTSELYTVAITMKIISSQNGRIIAGPVTAVVKYTAINADEKLREVIEKLTFDIRDELKSGTR